MDLNATWARIVQLYEGPDGRNWAELDELAEALATWMLRGGFPPHITGNRQLDELIAGRTCASIQSWEPTV